MIKKFGYMLAISTALALVCNAATADAASISDSVSRALGGHPAMKSRKATEDMARDALREQKSGWFPVLGASGRVGHTTDDNDTTRAFSSDPESSWLGEGTVTLTQPLFTGFGTTNRVAAARDRVQAAQEDTGTTSGDIALKAARAHLNLMRTRELLNLANDYLKRIEERKKSIALMLDEGAASESELLQADEILMAVRTTRLGYEEAYRQAEADYIEAVGAGPDERLEFGQPVWDRNIPATIDEAVRRATAESPRVKSADKVIAALSHDAEAERSSLYPQVNAELSYFDRDQKEDLGGEASSAQAMIKMQWSFATGGGQLARVDRALSERREAQARRAGAVREAEHDVRQKFTSMQIIDRQFQIMRDRETAADKIVNNYMAQFEGGKQSNLQLINANSRLFDAKASRTDAHYRRLLARFELLNAMGVLHQSFGAAAPVKTGQK